MRTITLKPKFKEGETIYYKPDDKGTMTSSYIIGKFVDYQLIMHDSGKFHIQCRIQLGLKLVRIVGRENLASQKEYNALLAQELGLE